MVSVWIVNRQKSELVCLKDLTRQLMSRLSEEPLECEAYRALDELRERISDGVTPDLFCLDFSLDDSRPTVQKMRKNSRSMLLIVVAPPDLSPLEYLRPDILAGGLLLRPFTAQQAMETLKDALHICLLEREEDSGSYYWVAEHGEKEAVKYSDILYFEAFNKHVSVITGAREYTINETIDHLEQSLPVSFVRCHRSFIVRRDRIAGIRLSQNILTLDTGEEIPLSRTYKPNLKGTAK